MTLTPIFAHSEDVILLPQDMVRMFRDDITITVVFFEDEYLRFC